MSAPKHMLEQTVHSTILKSVESQKVDFLFLKKSLGDGFSAGSHFMNVVSRSMSAPKHA